MASVFKPGNTALITGGASGIGLALAKKCHSHGMKVLIADWDDEALSSAPTGLATIKADVSSLDDWAKVKEKVASDLGGQIHLLALNAGRSVRSSWDDVASFRQTLDTNLYGVINGISTFLPTVQQTAAAEGKQTAIVITGSKQGITNPPGNPAYNASKAAVKALAEHLSHDLRATPGVAVHLLVPGWTFTGITGGGAGGGEKPAGAWWPEQVVDYLEKKMGEGKFYVVCPDNDVDEETDKKRMLWSVGDLVEGRPPLTRWRDESWSKAYLEWAQSH
jgi:NAD(P)-dependent dehydrogenase (short-subunit alcohol dehydrogenase family)